MGADADVIAVGPFGLFRDMHLLDYPVDDYTYMVGDTEMPARDNQIVVCTVAMANTTEQSHFLAEICNLGWPGLVDCEVKKPTPPSALCAQDLIGKDDGERVYCKLKSLFYSPGVKLYFRPNY
jgi:hypothetical protein